jgi:hypothetical protein
MWRTPVRAIDGPFDVREQSRTVQWLRHPASRVPVCLRDAMSFSGDLAVRGLDPSGSRHGAEMDWTAGRRVPRGPPLPANRENNHVEQ